MIVYIIYFYLKTYKLFVLNLNNLRGTHHVFKNLHSFLFLYSTKGNFLSECAEKSKNMERIFFVFLAYKTF